MPTYPPLRAEPADETGWPVGFFGPSGPAAAAGASGRANASLHVTYRESHGAAWPHSGLMGASGLLLIALLVVASLGDNRNGQVFKLSSHLKSSSHVHA